jgi:hypothetical protein
VSFSAFHIVEGEINETSRHDARCIGLGFLENSRAEAQVAYVAYDPVDIDCCLPIVALTDCYAPAPALVYDGPAVMRMRYRLFLGGVVTRFRYANDGYAPAVSAPAWWW